MMARRRQSQVCSGRGSALILTVVLTSLLAIVGVLFLMATRIDKMASSATSDGRELACAVDTVLAQISEDLVEDVPGVTNNQEYYDGPDPANPWLADGEPYAVKSAVDPNKNEYYWRQISNIRGVIPAGVNDVNVRNVNITTVGERYPVPLKGNGGKIDDANNYADADGDGVSDAKWFVLPGEMSSKGKSIYAAVRIIDNGGMLNVNTGYAPGNVLDPNATDTSRVDGSTPLQVNVLTLAHTPGTAPTAADAQRLRSCRANYASGAPESDLAAYEKRVIWRYLDTLGPDANSPSFTPFDTSDELELRYRFLLDHQGKNNSRVEVWGSFGGLSVPRELPGELADWYPRVAADGLPGAAAALDSKYAYRHVVTTYNMDRLIAPALPTLSGSVMPREMLNVNLISDPFLLRDVIKAVLEKATGRGMDVEATQIAVNLLDYIDDDDRVTIMPGPASASNYFGFERPCVYISEVACRQGFDAASVMHTSYAIELFKPYFEDADPQPPREDELRLGIGPTGTERTYPFVWTGHGTRRFQVLLTDDSVMPLGSTITFKSDESDDGEPVDPQPVYGYSRTEYNNQPQMINSNNKLRLDKGDLVVLERRMSTKWQAVDRSMPLPASLFVPDNQPRSIQLNIADNMCAWHQWTPAAVASTSLGIKPPANLTKDPNMFPPLPPLQAHPANKPLTNIGELGKIFIRNGYRLSSDMAMSDIMVDLQNSIYAELFNYLTVINPAQYQGTTDPNDPNQQTAFDPNRPPETRIMGRLNINTAPSFVLAQLPWMGYAAAGSTDALALQRARAIVARRNGDLPGIPAGPYKSIGELMQISQNPLQNPLLTLGWDTADNLYYAPTGTRGPDLTPDTALDDFEERDLIFTRISNLVTVRSDVFTAYILVRMGENGPQRRVVAVLDRSRVNKLGDQVRIVAEQLVPDPR